MIATKLTGKSITDCIKMCKLYEEKIKQAASSAGSDKAATLTYSDRVGSLEKLVKQLSKYIPSDLTKTVTMYFEDKNQHELAASIFIIYYQSIIDMIENLKKTPEQTDKIAHGNKIRVDVEKVLYAIGSTTKYKAEVYI